MANPNRNAQYLTNAIAPYNLNVADTDKITHAVSYADGSMHTSCIDLVIENNPSLISDFTVSDSPFAAGHHFISFKYKLSFKPHHADSRYTRPISKISPSAFDNILKSHIEASLNLESHLNVTSASPLSISEHFHPLLKSSNDYEAIITLCMVDALNTTAPAHLTSFKPRTKP
ncbi:hypothetical protein TKK_0002284 [Trichogramma kaykai]